MLQIIITRAQFTIYVAMCNYYIAIANSVYNAVQAVSIIIAMQSFLINNNMYLHRQLVS